MNILKFWHEAIKTMHTREKMSVDQFTFIFIFLN